LSSLPWRRLVLVVVVGAACAVTFMAVLYFS
jgi:hypothetical protein